MDDESRKEEGEGVLSIDLPYPFPCGAATVISEAVPFGSGPIPFGFRANYSRFKTIGIRALVPINGFHCQSIGAAIGFIVAIPIRGTHESNCGAVFQHWCWNKGGGEDHARRR
jgi:hypothetical protein